jgi:hypothetical protein
MTDLTDIEDRYARQFKVKRGFDYRAVSSPVAEFLKGQVHRIRRQAGISIIHIGKDLIAAKHYLNHGTFLNWVEAEVGIPARTAQAYMHVAEWASHKSATVALLPPSILYVLSSSSAPEECVDHILRRFESGEHITLPTVREEMKAVRRNSSGGTRGRATPTHDAPPQETTQPIAPDTDVQAGVEHAIAILARGLNAEDFVQVRDILTRKSVLKDRELGKKITLAFSALTVKGPRT